MIRARDLSSKLDRLLLGSYLIGTLVLLIAPVSGPGFELFGIGSDKFLHFALFGGLAVFLRWNLAARRHANLLAVAAAFVIGAGTEITQGILAYRSAEMLDLVADVLGAVLGTAVTNRILASPAPEQLLGIVITMAGLSLITLSGLADLIGLGDDYSFGHTQMAGTVVGTIVATGGIAVYRAANRAESGANST